MRGWRYRPFGPAGSALEIVVGLWLLAPALRPEPGEPIAMSVVAAALGALLIVVGMIGLGTHLRRVVERRSDRRS